jgi:hypothetical protein
MRWSSGFRVDEHRWQVNKQESFFSQMSISQSFLSIDCIQNDEYSNVLLDFISIMLALRVSRINKTMKRNPYRMRIGGKWFFTSGDPWYGLFLGRFVHGASDSMSLEQ